MGSLQDVLKGISKTFGNSVIKMGVDTSKESSIISMGSPATDYCLYGGIKEGQQIELSGVNASGKTTMAFILAGSYQKAELERNPTAPRKIVLIDNEGTADSQWASKFGYDMSETASVPTVYIRPEAQSAETVFDWLVDMIKSGEVGLMILDSIPTLLPEQIVDEKQSKQQMGGIAKALGRFSNSILGLTRKYNTTFIGINQVRQNMSGYGDFYQTPGGEIWRHNCAVRLVFKRGEFFDIDGNKLTKSAISPAGHIMEMAVLKTKISKWDRKMGYMHLNYNRGVDVIEDTIDIATHFGFIEQMGAWYQIINPNTAEVLTKVQGRKRLKEYLDDNKTVWRILYDAVYEKLSIKDDPHIKAFYQMLDTGIEEKFGVSFDD